MGASDKLFETMKTLPLGVRLLTVPFFLLLYIGWCMLLLFEYVLVVGAAVSSVVLFGFIVSSNPFLQVLGASLGSLLSLSSVAAFYLKAGLHLEKRGLKILDWLFIAMTLVMMGCFQWMGLDPFYWILFVVFPLFAVRIVITCIVNNKTRNPA